MEETLAALALSGGTTLVGAMATSAWQAASSGVARLFARRGDDVAGQLDDHAALVDRAPDPDQARQSLVPLWRLHLEDLLRRDPAAADELRDLIDRVRSQLPATEQRWVQTIVAKDGGQAFGAQGGNVIVHQAGPDRDLPGSGPSGTAV
ncbi:hypothetical protein [Nocardiopsis trehalosi]|uniref:hypothetical protein n=1 Tax=Nocardiopsis trehalosi TaxID=109329 RepID=UPI000836854C|nr:hypothetical protein [Nocardiopsis trehalosi]